MADPKTDEAEYLDREIMLAKDALAKLKVETLESLKRSADAGAWTQRYPWQSLGTAAVAGVGAGWVAGGAVWGGKKSDKEDTAAGDGEQPKQTQQAPEPMHAGARVVGGLGTIVGALASAIVGAATQSVAEVVKETVRETLKPESGVPPAPATNGHHDKAPVD
jgi:hypothetical protein